MDLNNAAVIILFIVLGFLIYQYKYYSSIETIVSKVDNRDYNVQIKDDSQEAADLIANIRKKLILLVLLNNNLIKLIKKYPLKIIN